MNAIEFAWAAGLFEGEGCIYSGGYFPALTLCSTDEDVVRRFREIVGVGTVRWRRPSDDQPHHKDQWRWDVHGPTARELLAKLLPFLGTRRRAKAQEVIARWESRPELGRKGNSEGACQEAGCEKPREARGLCNTHYKRFWRATTSPSRYSRDRSPRTDAMIEDVQRRVNA